MTRPLPSKIGPIEREWDTQSLLGVPSAILSFLTYLRKNVASHFFDWVLPSRAAHEKAKLVISIQFISITVYFVLHACMLNSHVFWYAFPYASSDILAVSALSFLHFFVGQYVRMLKV